MNNLFKKNAFYIIGIIINLITTLLVWMYDDKLTINILFICFSVVPMLLSLGFPLITTGVYKETKRVYLIIYCLFIYAYNYLITDQLLTDVMMQKISNNSGISNEELVISNGVDIGNIIITCVMIFGLGFFGRFIGNKIRIKKDKRNETLNK